MIHGIDNLDEFYTITKNQPATLVYFSHEQCNVCKILKPKIQELINNEFPKIKMCYVDTVRHPEIAAQNSILTVPTITIHFDGKEYYRKSRTIGIQELEELISKPYHLFFSEY